MTSSANTSDQWSPLFSSSPQYNKLDDSPTHRY